MKMKIIYLCLLFFAVAIHATAQCRVIAPDAYEWVASNREKIEKMTRAEWQELDEGYKWVVFGRLSPKQKFEFWIEKFEQVLTDFEWNEAEKQHLEKMCIWMCENPDLYDTDDKAGKEKQETQQNYLNGWIEYAIKELEWSHQLLAGMAMSCGDLLDKEGTVRVTAIVNVEEIKEIKFE